MVNNFQKQRISITVDAHLLAEIDKLSKNRSAAVEEGLRLWRKQQIEEKLKNFYQNHSQKDIEFDQGWAEFSQAQMEEILEAEGL